MEDGSVFLEESRWTISYGEWPDLKSLSFVLYILHIRVCIEYSEPVDHLFKGNDKIGNERKFTYVKEQKSVNWFLATEISFCDCNACGTLQVGCSHKQCSMLLKSISVYMWIHRWILVTSIYTEVYLKNNICIQQHAFNSNLLLAFQPVNVVDLKY